MIETARLEIRLLEKRDLESARHLHNEYSTLNMLTDPFHVSQEEQLVWFENLSKNRQSRRYVICSKESDEFYGVIRLDRIDMINRNAEVGADIHPKYRKRGIATEAYVGFIDYLFNVLGLHRLQLVTRVSNHPAISLYQKIGFRIEGTLKDAILRENQFQDLLLMSLVATEWSSVNNQ